MVEIKMDDEEEMILRHHSLRKIISSLKESESVVARMRGIHRATAARRMRDAEEALRRLMEQAVQGQAVVLGSDDDELSSEGLEHKRKKRRLN